MALAACFAAPLRAPAQKFEKSQEEKGTEGHEKKTRAGVKIAPPQGAGSGKSDARAVDDLFRALPDDARGDGEVNVPAEDFGAVANPEDAERKRLEQRRREMGVRGTDEELSGGRRSMDERHVKDLSDLERKLGVETEDDDDGKAPSYTLAIQKIKERFKARDYEEALIGVNDLLRHYPKSPQLLLMKGTLHQRMGQIDLALAAYERSFEYEPSRRLKAQIDYIRRLQSERERLRPRKEGIVIPLGVEDAQFVRTPTKETKPASRNTNETRPAKERGAAASAPAAAPPAASAAPTSATPTDPAAPPMVPVPAVVPPPFAPPPLKEQK